MPKSAADIVTGLSGLVSHTATEIARAPTGVTPGYHPLLGAAVTEDGRLRYVASGASPLVIDAIYTMTGTHTVLGDTTPHHLNFNHQIHDPLSQVTTGASWAFTAAAAGIYIALVNAPLSIGGGIDWVAADRADLTIQDAVNENVALFTGILVAAQPADLLLNGWAAFALAATDTIHAQIVQDSGTDRDIDIAIASIIIGHV